MQPIDLENWKIFEIDDLHKVDNTMFNISLFWIMQIGTD